MLSPKEALQGAEESLHIDRNPEVAAVFARTGLRSDPDPETRAKLEALLLEIEQAAPQTDRPATKPTFDPYGTIKSKVYSVVGTGFDRRPGVIRANCEKGVELQLKRERQNRHDTNAVAVYVCASGLFGTKLRQVGYLSREENEDVARWLDAGRSLYAKVNKVYAPPDREIPILTARISEKK